MQADNEIFSRLDIAFARFLSTRAKSEPGHRPKLEALLARLSQHLHQGHTCISINEDEAALLVAAKLATLNFTKPSDTEKQPYPLVIEHSRLYLQRYWQYENQLAIQLSKLAQRTYPTENLDSTLDRYFNPDVTTSDGQREAAIIATQRQFCIITGGPGTGKTSTIYKILAVLIETSTMPPLIALAAPTGKAAKRLEVAIAKNKAKMNYPEHIQKQIPENTNTLHRLLGAKHFSPYFKQDASNPLIFDVVLIDEASMVDLALMSKLVDALKPEAKLILVGDHNQLSSVESGAVLADIISALPSNTMELKHSYRYNDPIKKLSEAINQQQAEKAWQLLTGGEGATQRMARQELLPYLLNRYQEYFKLIAANADFDQILEIFTGFQVLCANRHGLFGAQALNFRIEQALLGQAKLREAGGWYSGRPVMVLQNHPQLKLYNGDIGICLPDRNDDKNLMVYFLSPDGKVETFQPARLPACETVFAMTIHKSQGSEFEEVVIVLPEAVNPVLCKELLYTAVTRAKKRLFIVSESAVFTECVQQNIARITGLSAKLKTQ